MPPAFETHALTKTLGTPLPSLTIWVALYFVLIMGISLSVFAKRDL